MCVYILSMDGPGNQTHYSGYRGPHDFHWDKRGCSETNDLSDVLSSLHLMLKKVLSINITYAYD